jgi:5-formyltetrahydrofolate cyclo-ligase
MIKKELRKIYKEQRLGIASKEKLKWDDLMLIQFQQFDFGNAQTLLTYWPMTHSNEPNTHLYSSYLRHTIPNLQMAYPVVDLVTGIMHAILINEETVYHTSAYGITEPKEGAIVSPIDIDIIFVPQLIYDKQGFRVGFGKGYYDKFLVQCRDDAVTIGFNYFEPINKIEDVNEFDIPLNYCITPQTIYEF